MAGVVPREATTPCAPPQTWRRPRCPEISSHKMIIKEIGNGSCDQKNQKDSETKNLTEQGDRNVENTN